MAKTIRVCLFALTWAVANLALSSSVESGNPPERYAVVLTAGEGCTSKPNDGCPTTLEELSLGTHEGFWSDAIATHDMLVYKYCFPEENIYVFFRDGGGLPNDCPKWDVLPEWRVFPAIKDTVERVFATLADKMDENDLLFVFGDSHGCCYSRYPSLQKSLFGLVGGDWTDELKDAEFGALMDSINCRDKIVFLSCCFAGGFVDELDGEQSVVVACNNYRPCVVADDRRYPGYPGYPECEGGGDGLPPSYDPAEAEVCEGQTWYRSEFSYHALNALKGRTIYYGNPVDADFNGDGWTSIHEAYAFVCSTDSYGGCGTDDARCYEGNDLHDAQIGGDGEAYARKLSLFGRIDLASGTLCQDITYWSDTVSLTGDVIVPSGKTLIVKPGTVVRCDSLDDRAAGDDTTDVEIIVYGTLTAEGTPGDSIKFTSRADPPPGQTGEYASDIWRGIRFEPGSSGLLEYVTVRRAYIAVDCDSASPSIKHASICDNQIAGIRCRGNAAPTIASGDSIASSYRGIACTGASAPVIRDGVVIDTCNVGIQTRGSSTPTIRDCRAKRCQKGISVAGDSDPEIQSGCDLHNNHQVGLYFNGTGVGTVSVDSLKARNNYSYGIRCDSGTKVTISDSEIYGNEDGVAAFDSTDCLLGRASPATAGHNNLYSNSACNIRNATTGGDTLFAENCWWGADPPDTSKICGAVDYDPWLTSKVQLALPASWGHWRTDDEAMVSFGSVISNPIDERVVLSYLVRHPGTRVKISVYNTLGQRVKTLVNAWRGPGQYSETWEGTSNEGRHVEPGVYFGVLEADHGRPQTAKLVVIGPTNRR